VADGGGRIIPGRKCAFEVVVMRVELFGLVMDTPGVTFSLWSPWRCTALEHKLFDALKGISESEIEIEPDEVRIHLTTEKQWKNAVDRLTRVLKGWQEEAADAGAEKRHWRWLVEADVDAGGFDHKGEKAAFWLFLRLAIDRGGPAEADKFEDVDLDGFGVCVWGKEEK
jgi:hypothetical protein